MTASTVAVTRARRALLVGLVVFLVLTGTGLAQAVWTTATTHTTTVTAGNLTAALDGPGLTANDITTDAWHGPTTVTIRNTSEVPVSARLAFTTTGTLEAQRVQLALWPRTGTTCPTTVPSTAATSTLAAPVLPASATTVAAKASVVLCAATRVSAELAGTAGQSLTATPVVTTTYPGTTWTATATGAAFTHTMAPAPASTPNPVSSIVCTPLANNRIQLSWTPVAGATDYRIEAPQKTQQTPNPSVVLTRGDIGGSDGAYRTVTITALGPLGNSSPVSTRVQVARNTMDCP
jgi:hypothetical protein